MPAMSATAADTTLVLIVRHAERVSDAPNSDLSDIGLARADRLAALAAEAGVQAVYATDFCRAAQTAQAAAEVLGLPIRVVATGNASAGLDGCSPGIDARRDRVEEPTPDGVARRVLREQRGGTVLVVGHSNTVPAIAEALGATVCPTLIQPDERGRCWLADDSYDKLFIIRVPTIDGGTARVQLSTIDPP
ncbi:MAG: histidine phosphatase family protein [Longimicrobiales bacterium]